MLWYNPYMKRNMPRLGAHVSAQGGFTEALSRAEAMGATAMQIFGSSPRTWSVRMPDEGDVRAFRARLSESPLRGAVYLHAAYLVNAASVSSDLYRNSVKSLAGHLHIAETMERRGSFFISVPRKEGHARKEYGARRQPSRRY
jgi:deoxyribonuclease-4